MLSFTHSSIINAPVEKVWEFHERQDILQLLTPPWQPVQIIRREGGLEPGAVSEFRLWLGIIPLTWIARHTECETYKIFVDTQEEGPLKFWTHRHIFTHRDNKTLLTDDINYELPCGEWSEPLLEWWVNSRLRDMFLYRHEVTQKICTNIPIY
ncbi:MAG: hypothetical protein N5P05_000141 [Chroococcopsis gigantea SAG 12.99]|jgi:ligand-binding SRPBCC domain-containing protein|nr:SRPBCC family protein [Chlorogloea purpurea SAG 13.99]MDV2998535.1 hypothetical protein [Chroococcopsis gigantea SAG 12.99]